MDNRELGSHERNVYPTQSRSSHEKACMKQEVNQAPELYKKWSKKSRRKKNNFKGPRGAAPLHSLDLFGGP